MTLTLIVFQTFFTSVPLSTSFPCTKTSPVESKPPDQGFDLWLVGSRANFAILEFLKGAHISIPHLHHRRSSETKYEGYRDWICSVVKDSIDTRFASSKGIGTLFPTFTTCYVANFV